VDHIPVPPEHLVFESEWHAEVSEDFQARVIKTAWDMKLALGEVHSHPRTHARASFSPSDLFGFREFVPHVWWRLKAGPYVAFVFGKTDFDALAWIENPKEPAGVDRFMVGGKVVPPTGITIQEIRKQEEQERGRYSRQDAFFGLEGQERIGQLRVAIVGLGGLGCHVAQQLAYLGVKRFVLIDSDRVSRSNLNRLVGAVEKDIDEYKVKVSKRSIANVQPDADVVEIRKSLVTRDGIEGVKQSDFIFGCVDQDGVRLVLLNFSCSLRKPYLDLASDVPDQTTFGGRVVFTGLGRGCPMCRGQLDQEEIRRYFATPEQREVDERIYGVRRNALAQTGPSVVFLNGLVASAAVTEFSVHVAGGTRPAFPFLVYRGEMGVLTRPTDKPIPDCYYCEGIWSGREQVDLNQFLW
jgi:hypothetical protein